MGCVSGTGIEMSRALWICIELGPQYRFRFAGEPSSELQTAAVLRFTQPNVLYNITTFSSDVHQLNSSPARQRVRKASLTLLDERQLTSPDQLGPRNAHLGPIGPGRRRPATWIFRPSFIIYADGRLHDKGFRLLCKNDHNGWMATGILLAPCLSSHRGDRFEQHLVLPRFRHFCLIN